MAAGDDEQTMMLRISTPGQGDPTPGPTPGQSATEQHGVIETSGLRVDNSYHKNPLTPIHQVRAKNPAIELSGGRMTMRESDGDERVSLRTKPDGASLRLSDPNGKAFAYVGSVDGGAALMLGGDGTLPGRLYVRDGKYQDRVQMWTSDDGAALRLLDSHGRPFAYLGDVNGRGELALGGDDRLSGRIVLRDGKYRDQIVLDADAGDILLMNADCAEYFDVAPDVEPGTVMVLEDELGALRPCGREYDPRVAGVLSGAGAYRPGIALDYRGPDEGRRPVALMGKVMCKVEAESAPVKTGTLLTTSSLIGHARAATDREQAFGAVLGKAMAGLDSGAGMVPVLVALQ